MTLAPTKSATPDQVRQDEIDRYEILGHRPGSDLQALVDMAAQVCAAPIAIVNLVTADRAHGIVCSGIDPAVFPREATLCSAVLEEPGVVVVTDATADERYLHHPLVDGTVASLKFYASVPLRTGSGVVIGRLCVLDVVARALQDPQRVGLEILADRVVASLDLRLRSRQQEQSLTELREIGDELRRSNDQLALFAGQVSHDLRTPLTALMINTDLLAGEPLVAADPQLQPLVQEARRAGERMAGLIDQFLGQATVGATVRKADTDLAQILRAVLRDLAPALTETAAEVSDCGLLAVRADPHQMYSVMLNLMSNAVKFARPGVPPRITVTASTLPDRWRVSIADNGIGIPLSQHSRVFEPFVRLQTRVDGAGIGLDTARRVIEAHGGRIGITEGRAVGTEVWFELPR